MLHKKGQGLSVTTILVAVLILIVLIVTVIVTAEVTGRVIDNIRESKTNEIVAQCSLPVSEGGAGFTGQQKEMCEQRARETGELTDLKVSDCGDTLGLTGDDLISCEERVAKLDPLLKLQSASQGFADNFNFDAILGRFGI